MLLLYVRVCIIEEGTAIINHMTELVCYRIKGWVIKLCSDFNLGRIQQPGEEPAALQRNPDEDQSGRYWVVNS